MRRADRENSPCFTAFLVGRDLFPPKSLPEFPRAFRQSLVAFLLVFRCVGTPEVPRVSNVWRFSPALSPEADLQ